MGSSSSKSAEVPVVLDQHAEDVLESLKRFDTVLVVDDSASMSGSRWKQAGKALATLAAVAAKYDTDGLEIQFLNSPESRVGIVDPEAVKALFKAVRPEGATPLGTKLRALLTGYLARLDAERAGKKTTKPVNFIVITDGVPTDGAATEEAILHAAQALDRRNARVAQVGVQFVQIGDDEGATAYLQRLDDELTKQGVRDMVDTTLPEKGQELDLVKILIGAVNRRVDNNLKGSRALVA
ncbi:putative von willebrand factor [Lyophyllum shimeji]|uniref:von willebrand factor n=1 Tax=Lyophyllum shimeji TaxID=47721 RepID=A0A9P3PP61_LYOSH|nr:putative von willebrand factor [Lyophyllum shimeji]